MLENTVSLVDGYVLEFIVSLTESFKYPSTYNLCSYPNNKSEVVSSSKYNISGTDGNCYIVLVVQQ